MWGRVWQGSLRWSLRESDGGWTSLLRKNNSSLKHDPSTHDRRHNLSGKLPSIKRRVLRLGKGLRCVEGPPLPGVEDGNVGKVSAGERPTSSQVKTPCWTGCKQLDQTSQRHALLLVKPGNRERERGLQ